MSELIRDVWCSRQSIEYHILLSVKNNNKKELDKAYEIKYILLGYIIPKESKDKEISKKEGGGTKEGGKEDMML